MRPELASQAPDGGPEKHGGNKERGNSNRPLCLLISSLEETSRKQTPFVLQKKHEATHK
jgi:hypothetical protein